MTMMNNIIVLRKVKVNIILFLLLFLVVVVVTTTTTTDSFFFGCFQFATATVSISTSTLTSTSKVRTLRIIGSSSSPPPVVASTPIITTTTNNNNPLLPVDVVTRYIPRGGGDGNGGNGNNGCVVVDFLRYVDLFGTGLFAFSGALTAGRKGMDLLGMIIIAMITATGGGTVRDILMNTNGQPVFWLQDPIYIKIAITVTILTYCIWPKLEQQFGNGNNGNTNTKSLDSAKIICYADAICLGTFAIVGTQKAVTNLNNLQKSPILWIVSGLLTAVFGGITRDILCLQKPRVLYPDRTMYGVPPLLGSTVYAYLISSSKLEMNDDRRKLIAACISIMVTFITRVLSFDNPRRLPHWKEEEEEEEEEDANTKTKNQMMINENKK